MKYETLRWKNGKLELIDQRLLPSELRYVKCSSARDVYDAIKKLKVRGAPAIGIAGAYGFCLGTSGSKAKTYAKFVKDAASSAKYIAGSRPTARDLFWALERMERCVKDNNGKTVPVIKELLLREAHAILKEDKEMCRAIGENGKRLIKKGTRMLTHCNAGALATGGRGTALSVIFSARKNIKMVFAGETRPVLQGARLTVWELEREKIPVTLICDNMAASIMAKGEIDAVIVGADRIAANGDTANKIGTYGLAVLAGYHGIPFYVAAPVSTFDLSIKTGEEIPIEERDHSEVRTMGGAYITLPGVAVRNPSFDVTPAGLITAIITERGIIQKPDRRKIERLMK